MPDRIDAPRLCLRRLRPADTAALAPLANDAAVARMLTRMPHPCHAADVAAYIAAVAENPWVFAVTRDGTPIGAAAVEERLGYWIGRAHWGRGYGFEAASALVSAWDAATGAALETGVFADNPASRRILARLGFVETGRRLQASPGRAEPADHIVMRRPPAARPAARGRIDPAAQQE